MKEELILKIKSLFCELIDIKKGIIPPGTFLPLPPNGYAFYKTAKDMVAKVCELETIDAKYNSANLIHTLVKEVVDVKNYEYKFPRVGNNPKSSSIDEMQKLMSKALHQMQLGSWELFGEIKID